ncbi:hypothetical protein I553_2535 [Mycobacterium xenopi 4042]|uniref:Uncharacterized protein n=1 Tax=Mycobacterium xenopi 4042 TaxID=1299334 RepID=X8CA85_MYCXE|nr:hypothetical protein I553_2535 [Mycobacterium xenopi 4042]
MVIAHAPFTPAHQVVVADPNGTQGSGGPTGKAGRRLRQRSRVERLR